MHLKRCYTLVLLQAALALWCGSASAGASCVTAAVNVAVSPAQAWAILSDFSVAHLYVPDLTRTEIISAQSQGVGAHRRVYQGEDDYLEETIIEWRDGQGFIIKLHNGEEVMAPFTRAQFSYSLQAAPAGGTTVELSMIAQMPWGKFGETLGDWFVTPAIEGTLVQVAAGLKSFYESGQPATDEDRERLAEQVSVVVDGPACEVFR
tara:strand:- start:126482 stop:127099 length:618 start_codon:yes stop_codon:yes gene_type:complete